jgi:hypothetical protein
VRGPDRQAGLIEGEVCTCPSRALVPGGIDDDIAAQGVKRAEQVRTGHPLDPDTMMGAQASNASELGGELAGGYDVQPTVFEGLNSTRILQEEIFGPVLSVTRFSDTPTPWRSPTTRPTAWAPASGHATRTPPTARVATLGPAGSG